MLDTLLQEVTVVLEAEAEVNLEVVLLELLVKIIKVRVAVVALTLRPIMVDQVL